MKRTLLGLWCSCLLSLSACAVQDAGVNDTSEGAALGGAPDGGASGPFSSGGAGSTTVKVSLVIAGSLPTGVTVDSAEVMIRDIRLSSGEVDHGPRVWKPITLNQPATFNFPLPAGCYSELRLKYEPQEGWNTGPSGRKVTALVKGQYAGLPFELRSDVYAGVELCGQTSLCAAPGSQATVEVAVNLATFLEGLDFSSAKETNGVLYIDDRSNDDIADAFGDNIKKSDAAASAAVCEVKVEPGSPGAPCEEDAQCASGDCNANGLCEPSGGGTRIPDGMACTDDWQCASGCCNDGNLCEQLPPGKLPEGSLCMSDAECASGDCSGNGRCGDNSISEVGGDGGAANGAGCTSDAACQSGACVAGLCEGTLPNGSPCTSSAQCENNLCYDGECFPPDVF